MENVRHYFKNSQREVVAWWNPEKSMAAQIYLRGLDFVMSELNKNSKTTRVLDAACGKGRISARLAGVCDEVVALDISEDMLDIVRCRALPNVHTCKADVDAIPFEGNSFDAVVCLEATVHFQDIEKVIGELYRVLKPGGILVVDIDNKYGLIRMTKELVNFVSSIFDVEYRRDRGLRSRIFRPISPREFQRTLLNKGFIMEKKRAFGVLMPFSLKRRVVVSEEKFSKISGINDKLERTPGIWNLGTYMYFVCRK